MSAEILTSKICSCCRMNLPIVDYFLNKNNYGGLDHYCKVCKKQWQKKNKDKINDRRKVYRREKGITGKPRKPRKQKNSCYKSRGKVYAEDWFLIRMEIYVRDYWRCKVCGTKCTIKGKTKIQCHHINHNHLDNNRENLVTLCASCHITIHRDKINDWIYILKEIRTMKAS